MKVHAIETERVAVKSRQREGKGRGWNRMVNTLMDRDWTETLPIYAWLIEHPEGPTSTPITPAGSPTSRQARSSSTGWSSSALSD